MYRQAWHRNLRRGHRGEEVRRVQELLRRNGHDPGPIDGIFGPRTEAAVKSFQSARRLTADGIVGPITWRALTQFGTGKARGRSVHIGLNVVDNDAYGVAVPPLRGCENDARAMQALAEAQGFSTTLLRNEQGTAENVIGAIRDAAEDLTTGDFFLLTYAGHGSQVPDIAGDEADGMDETWVLYDRQLIDDELYALWGEFPPGVRILVVSDSCHSGTVARMLRLPYQVLAGTVPDSPDSGFMLESRVGVPPWARHDLAGWRRLRDSVRAVIPGAVGELRGEPGLRLADPELDSYVDGVLEQLPEVNTVTIAPEERVRTRDLPLDLAHRDFTNRLPDYRQVKVAASQARPPRAHVLLLAACQDEQLALDGARNGLFTQCLLAVWDGGRYDGVGYQQFHQRILNRLTAPQQTPKLFWATPVEPRFEQQRPFTI